MDHSDDHCKYNSEDHQEDQTMEPSEDHTEYHSEDHFKDHSY